MSNPDASERSLPYRIPDDSDAEMADLIDSWRYRGAAVAWDEIVGHTLQIRRCLELAEKLRRTPDELAALGIRLGAGLVISGPSGTGKTLMARALATELGREVIVPPTAELTAESIHRLYADLGKRNTPSLVLLDDVELVIGQVWQRSADPDALASLLEALDGIDRSTHAPVTVALTTTPLENIDEGALRPGRLAPRLVLETPSREERDALLRRLIERRPVQGAVDVEAVVDRTGTWTGAELAGAIDEAMSRSLLDHTDALRQDLLLEVVAERYVVNDEWEEDEDDLTRERIARHEAGHALYAWLALPGALMSVTLGRRHGETRLHDALERRAATVDDLRRHAELALAGSAGELITSGPAALTEGGHRDRVEATSILWRLMEITKPYATEPLEAGNMSDHGSERMRAAWHAGVEALAAEAHANAVRVLAPYERPLRNLAQLLLDAPDQTLSGDLLEAAVAVALTQAPTPP
jgi:AAA+ superfamily predicted ATPase